MNDSEPESMTNADEYNAPSINSAKFRTVTIFNDSRWSAVPGLEAIICQSAGTARDFLGGIQEAGEEIGVLLTSDTEMRSFNLTYRGQDSPTNVLSFPAGNFPAESHGGPVHRGDIILSFDTIECEARELNILIEDHVSHLTVHGLLHLFGYDHQTDHEANQMEMHEIQILDKLGIPNPYVVSELMNN